MSEHSTTDQSEQPGNTASSVDAARPEQPSLSRTADKSSTPAQSVHPDAPEQSDSPDQPVKPASSARGPVIALIALLAVVLVGYLAYGHLSESEASRIASERAQQDQHGDEDSQDDLPQLSDYDATVYTEDGSPLSLTRIAGGKPLVMNFWATWCPYCIDEMDDYQAIYDDYADRVSFAFIDCVDGKRETVADGTAWLRENDHDLPAYYDTRQEAMAAFGAYSLPTTVIVDATGSIQVISPGRISPTLMRESLDTVLES